MAVELETHFSKIDVPNRFVAVSFSGPWGFENNSIYIKTRLSFPKDYPEKAGPALTIEKTASVSNEVLQKISSEVELITNAYLYRQKSSFEALLRYLLGEQSLGDSLLWLKERPDHIDLELTQDLASSSSDEDDDVNGYLNSRDERTDMGGGIFVVSNAQYNVPSPKLCGALWSGDGQLVCFFPPKEDKSHSLLDLTLRGSERYPRSHKSIFEGFGRLHNRSPIPKKTASALETIESESSGDEDITSPSSSSSSSSEIIDTLSHHFIPSTAWRGDASETQRALSLDESQKSSGGTGNLKPIGSRFASFISIHNIKDYLPSKRELAKHFVFNGPECCATNAKAATKAGDRKLADIWELIELMLREDVALDLLQNPYKDGSIRIVKRPNFSKIGGNDNAECIFDMAEDVHFNARGSVKWGAHPFGQGLVKEM